MVEDIDQTKLYAQFTAITGILILTFITGKILHKSAHIHKNIITESGITIIIGLIIGSISHLIGWTGSASQEPLPISNFSAPFFEFIVLPAIIFESGFSLKKQGLFRNFGTIIAYAILGTILNALVIGALIYAISLTPLALVPGPIEAFLFGSIISAVDPVATLAVLGDVFNVRKKSKIPQIYTLVFGESVINDAVAIVLYRIFLKQLGNPNITIGTIGLMALQFTYVCLGSVCIGLLVGFLSALFFKYVSFRNTNNSEILVLALFGFFSYFLANLATLSGIMSLFTCGIIMGRFTWYNLTEYSRISSPQFFKSIALLAETYVFLYLGIAVFGFMDLRAWNFWFVLFAIIFCIFCRALHVFPITIVANLGKRKKISLKEMIVLWFSGLRGAVAFALALDLYSENPQVPQILTTTLVIILFTTFFIGSGTYPLLKLLRLDYKDDQQQQQRDVEVEFDEVESNTEEATTDTSLADNSLTKNGSDDVIGETPKRSNSLLYRLKRRVSFNLFANNHNELSSYNPGVVVLIDENLQANKEEEVVFSRLVDRSVNFLDSVFLKPIFRKRVDERSSHLRDLVLSESLSYTRLASVDFNKYPELIQQAVNKNPKTNIKTTVRKLKEAIDSRRKKSKNMDMNDMVEEEEEHTDPIDEGEILEGEIDEGEIDEGEIENEYGENNDMEKLNIADASNVNVTISENSSDD